MSGPLDAWYIGSLSADPKKLAAQLQERLSSLENLLEGMRLSMLYGPVAGAYLPFFFRAYGAGGTVTGGTGHAGVVVPVNCRPVAVSAWADDVSSQLTINFDTSTTGSVLTVDWQFTGSGLLNARGDFALDVIAAGEVLALNVISVADGGTPKPTTVTVALWVKNASRIEP